MSSLRSASIASLSSAFLLAAACGSNSSVTPGDGGHDAGSDAGSHDAGSDAGPPGDGGSPPGAPVLSFTTSAAGVQLTWTLPGAFGDERFEVYRSDQGGPFSAVTGATSVTADAYADPISSALPGAGHAYEVTARNGNGTGPASNVVHVLQAPGDLAAGASDTRVLLIWSAVQNAGAYDVYRSAPDAGSATKLATVTTGEFVDDGGTLPIVTGNTYQYQLIAQSPDGGQPSTGSNIATVKALGIDVLLNITHVSDLTDGGVTVPETTHNDPQVLGSNDAGTLIWTPSFTTSTASVIPGIPAGPYQIALPLPGSSPENFIYFARTSARSIDLGSAVPGRVDATYPSNLNSMTTITYALTGLDAWDTSDAGLVDTLQSVSVGAGNAVIGLEGTLVDGGTDAGLTAFDGLENIDGNGSDFNLVDSSKGDIYYLSQLHATKSSHGTPYQSLTKAFTSSSLLMVDGANTNIGPAMSAPPMTNIADLVVKNTAFLAQKTGINPAAASAGQTVSFLAQKDFTTYGEYGAPQTLATLTLDGSATGDVDVGAISYGNPFPASWQPYVEVMYTFNVPFALPTQSAGNSFASTSQFREPTAGLDFTTAIAPPSAPVTSPKINGTLDAFADNKNVGLTPTFSWSAPASGAAPNSYVVSVYELALDAGGTVQFGNSSLPFPPQDFSFITTGTSISVPSGVFTAEDSTASHWYFATIDAQYTKAGSTPVDQTVTPYKSGSTYYRVQLVTNKFTPGPGVSPPSGYRAPRARVAVPPPSAVR